MINAVVAVVQNTITPLLTAVVLALLGIFFAWLQKKYHIQASQARQDYVEAIAVRAIAFAEEEGAQFIKEHGSKLPSDTKLSDAVTFLLRTVPALSEDEARDLITAVLGKTSGAGATEDSAITAKAGMKGGQSGFIRLKQVFFLLALAALVLAFASCAAWKADTTAGYESTGAVLAGIETQAKSMCDSGKIKPADCATLKAGYNKARLAYITSGDALILALDSGDAAAKQKSLAAYQQALSDLSAFLPELITTADQLGIKTSGAQQGFLSRGASTAPLGPLRTNPTAGSQSYVGANLGTPVFINGGAK